MSAESSSTALAAAPAASLVKTSVPPGVRIKWYQRKETIWIDIEAPDIQVEEVAWDDDGTVQVRAKNPMHCVTLQLLHRIHTSDSRWWLSGRCLKMELAKAEYGLAHWDRLAVGEKLPNVLIDWTSWIDKTEEAEVRPSSQRSSGTPVQATSSVAHPSAPQPHFLMLRPTPTVPQIRNNPYGHDVRSMASAMGKHWGSNVDRSIKAKEQAQKVDTSNPDDEEDEITMA